MLNFSLSLTPTVSSFEGDFDLSSHLCLTPILSKLWNTLSCCQHTSPNFTFTCLTKIFLSVYLFCLKSWNLLFFFFFIIQTSFILTLSVIAHNFPYFSIIRSLSCWCYLIRVFFSIKIFVDKLCCSWSFQMLACLQMFLFTLSAYVVSGYNYGITVLFSL